MTIPQQLKSTLTCCDSIMCSVFRPAKCSDWLLQEARIFRVLAKKGQLVSAIREASYGPRCALAPTATRIECRAQLSRLGVGHSAEPLSGIHALRIVAPYVRDDSS